MLAATFKQFTTQIFAILKRERKKPREFATIETRKKMLVVLALLLSTPFLLVSAAFYPPGGPVVELTSKNWDSTILSSPQIWIVEFYAPWCGHCQKLAPEYLKAAAHLRGYAKVGAIDCNEDANKPLCGRYNVQGFPTIKAFSALKTGKEKLGVDYQGQRTGADISKYAMQRLTSANIQVVDKSGKLKLDDFMAGSKLPKVILFSDKKSSSDIYKALSIQFHQRLSFAEVRKADKEVLEKFGVKKSPTIVYVTEASDDKRVIYEGENKVIDIANWLTGFVGGKKEKPSSDKKPADSDKPKFNKREPLDPNVPHIQTIEDYRKACLEPAEKVMSTLCFVAFLPPLELEFEESVKRHAEILALLRSAKKAMYAMGEKEVLPNMHFMWLDGTAKYSTKIIQKFGISSDLPSALVLHPKKRVYRPFIRAFDEPEIRAFLKETARGTGRAIAYDWDVELPAGSKPQADDKKPADTSDGKDDKPKKDKDHEEL
eukprot:Partr_v1_DN26398_c0_g1_i1_m43241 putative NA